MKLVALNKSLKQEFWCVVIAFSLAGLVELDTCGAVSNDEDKKIKSLGSVLCSPPNTPNAFCTQPH